MDISKSTRRHLKLIPIVLCACVAGAYAVDFPLRWRWSHPLPNGNNIIDMAFNETLAVQVAERGQIYTSDDLESWVPRDSGVSNALRAVTFFHDRIVVTGESGTILYADDPADFHRVDLETADWLEDVTASDDLLVATGDNGAVYTSEDAQTWNLQSTPFDTWLRGVAFGNNLFVAVGEGGLIATSPDGVTWSVRDSGVDADLNRVEFGAGGFVAVGAGGTVLSSVNGEDWTPLNSGAVNDLNTLAINDTITLVGGNQELRLLTSGTWQNQLDAAKLYPAPSWTYLSAFAAGDFFLVGGRTGMLLEGFRAPEADNDFVWLPVDDSPRTWLWDIVRMPELYLTVGDQATVMTSEDGIDWSIEYVPEPYSDSVFLGVGGKTNLAVAVGNAGALMLSRDELVDVVVTNEVDGEMVVETNQISSLGIIWDPVDPSPTTQDLQGVAVHGDRLVVTGGAGQVLLSDNDGESWEMVNTPTANFLSSVVSYPDGLVAVGDNGTILTSANGDSWDTANMNTTNWLYRVRYFNERLIVVGESGTILTSSDGDTWTPQDSGTDSWLTDVHYLENTYFIVGTQGTLLASADLTDWTSENMITGKSLYGLASHDGKLVTVGIEGIILRSQITPILDPIHFIDFSHTEIDGTLTDFFLLGGQPDQRFTLERTSDFQTWESGPQREILDSSGTQIFYETRTNDPPEEFFRATPTP